MYYMDPMMLLLLRDMDTLSIYNDIMYLFNIDFGCVDGPLVHVSDTCGMKIWYGCLLKALYHDIRVIFSKLVSHMI